jgi:hypothetical protein
MYVRDDMGLTRSHGNRKRKECLTKRMGEIVRDFFERDDVSRLGVKQTITRLKVKKRIMNDSMKNLYKTFIEGQKLVKINYTSFCRLRPFWVVSPTEKDRYMCLQASRKLFTTSKVFVF